MYHANEITAVVNENYVQAIKLTYSIPATVRNR